jgi:hypothetical protein
MAGDWIKLETATPDKPEIDQIADFLGIDHDAVLGKLVRLWIWADQQTVDGNALSVTKKMLGRITFAEDFADALISCGWLAGQDGQFTITNFEIHNGKSAKSRALTNRRVTNSRKCNAVSVTKTYQKALPEKRREEKSVITLTSNNKARGSIDELKAYAVGLGMPASDGESMFDHWESNGWRNGSSATKDWQAGMRKWKSQGWLPSQKAAAKQQPAHRQRGYQENLQLP